jgi:hypothetical protein
VRAGQEGSSAPQQSRRVSLLGLTAAVAAAAGGAGAARAEPYLLSTGARGLLAEEEAKLVDLRRQLEGEVRREIEAERQLLEKEARSSSVGGACRQGVRGGRRAGVRASPACLRGCCIMTLPQAWR